MRPCSGRANPPFSPKRSPRCPLTGREEGVKCRLSLVSLLHFPSYLLSQSKVNFIASIYSIDPFVLFTRLKRPASAALLARRERNR